MGDIEITTELILMLSPLLLIQFGLSVYCLVKIFKEGVENLNKWAWIAICLFINLIGPVTFLIIGRKKG